MQEHWFRTTSNPPSPETTHFLEIEAEQQITLIVPLKSLLLWQKFGFPRWFPPTKISRYWLVGYACAVWLKMRVICLASSETSLWFLLFAVVERYGKYTVIRVPTFKKRVGNGETAFQISLCFWGTQPWLAVSIPHRPWKNLKFDVLSPRKTHAKMGCMCKVFSLGSLSKTRFGRRVL